MAARTFQVSAEDRRVARRVAAARAIAEISQDQLAQRLTRVTGETWTKARVGKLEQGRKLIPAGLLYHLAEALGQDPVWFLADGHRPNQTMRPLLKRTAQVAAA